MAIALIWFVGFLVAVVVLRVRAGAPAFSRLKVTGPGGYGIGWTMMSGLKAALWPVTLVAWLLMGRPEPRILFNEKAELRERGRRGAAGSG